MSESYQRTRIAYWNGVASQMDRGANWGRSYHERLKEIYRFLVPSGQRVLELGCARGDLLSAVQPAYGVGIDFSSEMVAHARKRHPQLVFHEADAHDLGINESFDVVILSDLINDAFDVQRIFEKLRAVVNHGTRILINTYSHLWEPLLGVSERLGLARPTLRQNWLTVEDTVNLLRLAGLETVRTWQEILCPLPIPLLARFANQYLVKVSPFRYLALTNFVIARAVSCRDETRPPPLVSVIVPARNEAGNIQQIFERTPQMGRETELIFVEGHSQDDTVAEIEKMRELYPAVSSKLLHQTGVGKGDAVRLGFQNATGEVLMILDADLTVPPEDLVRFYEALYSGKGELINGSRLVYPMENRAMRFLNLVGNKFFSLVFSWLLGQPIKDTLCGTKALWKAGYGRIAEYRNYFGEFDPFGDFDLIFGAARLNLKIIDLPIRYRERTYGTTNIHRWRHGWLLLKMVWFALGRLKFV